MLEVLNTEGRKVLVDIGSILYVVQQNGYVELYLEGVPFPINVICKYEDVRQAIDNHTSVGIATYLPESRMDDERY